MQIVNRAAIIVRGNQPFLDWIHSTQEEDETPLTLGNLRDDPVVYLVREYETDRQQERVLSESYPRIFEEQLNGWYMNPETWPEKRDLRTFRKWFDVDMFCMVVDQLDKYIGKER